MSADAGLEIRLLGPVEVLRDGVPVSIGGPQVRTVLAMLALQPGVAVTTDRLIEALWGDEARDGTSVTLRTYVSRLRTVLREAGSIEHLGGGYVLRVNPTAVDALRFEARVRDGGRALEQEQYRLADGILAEALDLWRGDPFGGIDAGGALRGEAIRLGELHVRAVENWFAAGLELGRAADLVNELERQVAAHPHRERLWRHLMIALYRADRQADALAAYHRARAALDEELGLEPGEELRALEAAVLRQDVPAAAAASSVGSSIPTPLTRFIGREAEVAAISGLLERTRFVSLIGVGGTGKTRLAIEVARRVEDRFADGAAFVDLATIRDPSLLVSHVAAGAGTGAGPGDPMERLSQRLRRTEQLLVLDNCEHLREAVADLARTLLEVAPNLRILATSREVVGVPGEFDYPVPPLRAPEPDRPLDELRDADAVKLLFERAEARGVPVEADAAALRVAARICRELDGLPLAIELAAARSTALSFEDIADRLSDRFRLLVSWRQLAPARHQTLRQAMDWSFDLLGEAEANLLVRLSVFGGPFRLESVAEVCLGGDAEAALVLIEHLVDASLVNALRGDRGLRFGLYETVRQYAASRLEPADAADVNRRLAEHMRRVVERSGVGLEAPQAHLDYAILDDELPNLRVALAWALDADASLGIEIATLLERYWAAKALSEGLAILGALLDRSPISEPMRARALRATGGLRFLDGDFEGATAPLLESLEIYRRLGDDRGVRHLMLRLAIHFSGPDPEASRTMVAEALAMPGEGHFAEDEYLAPAALAFASLADGNIEAAQTFMRDAAAAADRNDEPWTLCGSLANIAAFALMRRRPEEASEPVREAIRVAQRLGDRVEVVHCLGILSEEAAQLGHDRRAGRLWGAASAEMERGGLPGQLEGPHRAREGRIRAEVGPEFEVGVAEGRQLSFNDAFAEALATSAA